MKDQIARLEKGSTDLGNNAADGTYTGTIDMTRSEGNQVKAERVESDLTLEGRNEASNGGIQFQKNVDQDQTIQLTGRRD
ncbi:hypothetical protein [Vibrio splendidus]|uniref:Uncharacterized protein n=1 Tax=Vibrio splendidus TaxID=29497 RepID=A0A2T5DW11_VIBSP|nr:hypothetical protein [Vibrio splendidus]PTP10733.1 hypothetical protein CWO36_25500 [Vibrio splendidus]